MDTPNKQRDRDTAALELATDHIGQSSHEVPMTVTAREMMNYAASVDDVNPRYFDDTVPGGVVGPPMLAVALTWRLMGPYSDFWPENDFPIEVLSRMVHYTEMLEWHELMHADDTLTLKGTIESIVPRSLGCYLVYRTDAHNQHGVKVFTEYAGALLRGVKGLGPAAGAENVPDTPKWEAGDPVWTVEQHIGKAAAHVYDGCTDITFPIHTSKKTALAVGLPGTIYHGAATLSRAVAVLIDRELGGDPARAKGVSCRFTAMVLPDTPIQIRYLGSSPGAEGTKTLFFDVLNSEGKASVSRGCLTARP